MKHVSLTGEDIAASSMLFLQLTSYSLPPLCFLYNWPLVPSHLTLLFSELCHRPTPTKFSRNNPHLTDSLNFSPSTLTTNENGSPGHSLSLPQGPPLCVPCFTQHVPVCVLSPLCLCVRVFFSMIVCMHVSGPIPYWVQILHLNDGKYLIEIIINGIKMRH